MKMRLGLAGGPVPRDASAVTPVLARELASLGIRALVTHFQAPPEVVAGNLGQRVRAVLSDAGITIAQATGYNPNLVHPDDGIRLGELRRLRAAFDAARALGAEMIITGCGSHHPSFFYGPAAANHTPPARERLIDSLRGAAPWAEEAGIVLALECHVLTTLDTPEHIREILTSVNSSWVRVNFDPVNLIGDLPAVYDSGTAMARMCEILAPYYAPTAHIKDIAPQPELVLHLAEVPPGEGLLDYAAFFGVCRRLGEGTTVIVEHLDAARVRAALDFVKRIGARYGVVFEGAADAQSV